MPYSPTVAEVIWSFKTRYKASMSGIIAGWQCLWGQVSLHWLEVRPWASHICQVQPYSYWASHICHKTHQYNDILHRFSTAGGDPLVHLASNPVFMPNFPGWAFFKVMTMTTLRWKGWLVDLLPSTYFHCSSTHGEGNLTRKSRSTWRYLQNCTFKDAIASSPQTSISTTNVTTALNPNFLGATTIICQSIPTSQDVLVNCGTLSFQKRLALSTLFI